MIGSMPQLASALPSNPSAFGTKSSYKLFSRLISYINVNRVYMGVNTLGEVGVDSAGRGTTQGGFWPRGTPDNYVFNSGMQVAGVVAGVKSTANPWGGDTTGGWFFDGAGGRTETEAVTPAYQAFNAGDAASWPAQAFVPQGDAVADIYAQPLQGLISASQGDVEFLSWDGNPKLNTARLHPLGVMVDYRLLAWNYPAGAQDVVFVVATVYNVTSSNCNDYAAQRPAIAAIACVQGAKFQTLNNAQFGITLPVGGYTIINAYTAFAADNDVGTVNSNYNSAILPFAMGYTYDGPFTAAITGWKFDPSIFGAPFFAGSGFVGYKYLKGPDGPGAIQLMSTFCNGAATCGTGHSDPGSMGADYRLMAGLPYPTDGQCNITSPGLTAAQIHFCYMLIGAVGTDTRMIESSTVTSLAPGQAKTIVVAYVYAAPVAIPGFTPNGTNVPPGDVTRTSSTDSMFKYNQSGSPGANRIDSISGFLSYNGPHFNADGSVHLPVQTEFSVVKGSLLGKALVAQAVFDAHFLQEFAPDAPQFFLIPGNKQVTILWKPSDTETIGDPFFSVVSNPTSTVGGLQVNNPLYDPNYRQFDVEGYRIYRGRSDSPNALVLLIQFDYAGTKIKDYTGFVEQANPTSCAPELGITGGCPATTPAGGFPTPANPIPPGTAATRYVSYNIGPNTDAAGNVWPLMFVDQTAGTREALNGNTTAIATVVDTVVSGAGDQSNGLTNPPLADTGVPFIFVDVAGAPGCAKCGVNNGVNYFYSVTAFDVNAPGHGPTSLESARVTKQVVPQAAAGNVSASSSTLAGTFGRGTTALTDNVQPTLDSITGKFSKKFPPSTGLSVSLAGLPVAILKGAGAASVQYDSTVLTGGAAGGSVSFLDWFTAGAAKVSLPFTISEATTFSSAGATTISGTFPAVTLDSTLTSIYGGTSGYALNGSFSVTRPIMVVNGRGCANSWYGTPPTGKAAGQCYFFGPRWFTGDNETVSNPNVASPATQVTGTIPNSAAVASYADAGAVTGAATIHYPTAYGYFTGTLWRDFELMLNPYTTASDYRLYWGTAGKIDSVVDLTYNTAVPFKPTINASWGVLNQSAATAAGSPDNNTTTLTTGDFTCIAPLPTFSLAGLPHCTTTYVLANTVVPGQIGYVAGASMANAPVVAANAGFGLYIKGRVFLVELTGGAVPAAGTAWTMRDYLGGVYGGNGTDPRCAATSATPCQWGTYAFLPMLPLPFNAPGASVQYTFNVSNQIVPTTAGILANVHTVPDPYYVTSAYDIAVNAKDIQFVNVPTGATIRIYSSSGILLRVLQNTTTQFAGIVHWDVRNRTNQFVSSGVYFYTVSVGSLTSTGRMTIVQYASTVQ
jgi:hypothetical protein